MWIWRSLWANGRKKTDKTKQEQERSRIKNAASLVESRMRHFCEVFAREFRKSSLVQQPVFKYTERGVNTE